MKPSNYTKINYKLNINNKCIHERISIITIMKIKTY